jgi:ABC-type sugar transport system permease subunit
MSGHSRWPGLAFILPVLTLVAVFVYSPLVDAVLHSFTRWDGIGPATPVGADNYRALAGSSDFHRVLTNQLILVAGVVIWVVVPLWLSMLLYQRRYAAAARALLVIPPLLPPVIVGSVFRMVLSDAGPVNTGLRGIGLDRLALGWLTDQQLVLFSIVFIIAWATMGTGVLFYSAALSSLDPALPEVARMDGAAWWQLAWHLYRPHLRPVTRFWMLLLTVATVTAFFPWIYPLTNGGPGIASTTLDFDIWATGIRDGQFGRASAIAVVSLVFIALLLGSQVLARSLRERRHG